MPVDIPLPRENPEAWNYLFIGVHKGVAPGTVKSLIPKSVWDDDKKKGSGTTGATLTINGEKLWEVQIVLSIWDDPEWPERLRLDMQRVGYLREALFPGGKKAGKPFDCYHPKLAAVGLRSLFFETGEWLVDVGPSMWEIRLGACQYAPPPKKPKSTTTTPSGSSQLGGTPNALVNPKDTIGSGVPFGPPPPPKPAPSSGTPSP